MKGLGKKNNLPGRRREIEDALLNKNKIKKWILWKLWHNNIGKDIVKIEIIAVNMVIWMLEQNQITEKYNLHDES